MPMNCVDVSNYSRELSADELAQWKSIGISLVVVQAILPPPGFPAEVDRQQAQAVLDAGLKLGVYVFHWTGTSIARNNATRFASYGFPVERWWADFEDTTATAPAQREDEVSGLLGFLDTLGGKRPAGAYSGKWWTDGYLPTGSQVFAGRAIWVAQYDNIDTLQAAELCGGTVAIHQYIGTSTLRGVGNVDLDVADPGEFTDPEPTTADPEPTTAQPTRETPDDYPFPDWRQSAIAYRGALDAQGQQIQALKTLLASGSGNGQQITDLQAQLKAAAADRDSVTLARNELQARIARAQQALAA